MKHNKKRKTRYSVLSNIAYMYGLFWKHQRYLFLTAVILVPAAFFGNLIGTYLPTIMIDTISASDTAGKILLVVFGIFTVQLLIRLIHQIAGAIKGYCSTLVKNVVFTFIADKYADLDYEQLLQPDIRNLGSKLDLNNRIQMFSIPFNISDIFIDILTMLVFGGIIGTLHPMIALLLLIPVGINYLFEKNHIDFTHKRRDEDRYLNNKKWYITTYMHSGNSYKDVLLYGMRDFICDRANAALTAHEQLLNKIRVHGLLKAVAACLLTFVRDGLAYVYLIYRAVQGDFTPGEFILYFSVISNFSSYLRGIFDNIKWIYDGSLVVDDVRIFLEIKSHFKRDSGVPVPTAAPSVEFVNVSYTYPEADKPTIRNLSFRIEPSENIALVGLNGAGKTTVIKLLCGMFRPTEGKILINGVDIMDYNRDEYYSIITALFQSFKPLPLTIRHNITSTSDLVGTVDEERLANALRYADLEDYIAKLPKGLDTRLVRNICDDATEPSGGEMQRILLARAYYNNRPMMVLDEPTAALDPIAESRMYERYAEFSKDKTTVFISHRLASTRFCNRILLIENGELLEIGSHEELIRKNGRYAELFGIQSQYYNDIPGEAREGGADDEE
ncbi:MAG: ABC transporter ATP-binding protein [Clostridia bacterium]|nr:ABC transporter ATP-binding protein [Clostridia bacterium]